MKRKRFRWVDPVSGKKYKLDVTPDFKRVLKDVIETEEQAESFFAAYAKCCESKAHAEYSIGYIASLIKDPDIRNDVLDLFCVEERLSPVQLFRREYAMSEWVRKETGKVFA